MEVLTEEKEDESEEMLVAAIVPASGTVLMQVLAVLALLGYTKRPPLRLAALLAMGHGSVHPGFLRALTSPP